MSENVPWMKSSERCGDTGVPVASAAAASVSSVTSSQPSSRPRFFHEFFSKASTSFGSTRVTSLSPASLATFTTMALMA